VSCEWKRSSLLDLDVSYLTKNLYRLCPITKRFLNKVLKPLAPLLLLKTIGKSSSCQKQIKKEETSLANPVNCLKFEAK
jgi:hypothetical protein